MKKKILFIDYLIPTPDEDAGSLLAFNTMLILKKSNVDLIFTSYCSHNQKKSLNLLKKYKIFYLDQRYLDDYLTRHGHEIDVVYGTRYNAFGYLLNLIKLKCVNAKIIFHTVDLAFLRETRELKIKKPFLKKTEISMRKNEIRKLKEHELECIRKSDLTILTSHFEKQIIKKYDKKSRFFVLGLVMKKAITNKNFNKRKDIFFLGNYNHTPNMDAINFFVKNVLNILIKLGFKDNFLIVGSHKKHELKHISNNYKQVKYIGFQKNLKNIFSKTRLFVSPLRFGAGVKGKLASSIVHGLPAVCSKITIEGMKLEKQIVTYSNKKDFAKKIIKYYQNEKLWFEYSKKMDSTMEKKFGIELFCQNLQKIFEAVNVNVKINNKTKLY